MSFILSIKSCEFYYSQVWDSSNLMFNACVRIIWLSQVFAENDYYRQIVKHQLWRYLECLNNSKFWIYVLFLTVEIHIENPSTFWFDINTWSGNWDDQWSNLEWPLTYHVIIWPPCLMYVVWIFSSKTTLHHAISMFRTLTFPALFFFFDFSNVEDRISIIGGHVTAASESLTGKSIQNPSRTRPPITTHVLDVSRGCPAAGIEVLLEMWRGNQACPTFGAADGSGWVVQGSSTTDPDGRSGQLLSIVDYVNPGIYRISFNTGKYNPNGFFPYVSVVFEILESQKRQHFHVPLLLSPFSFSTYRGS